MSNTQEVYERLHEMLLDGEIAPGTPISQVKLAREMGVSTTPLREAMRLLEADGLLVAEYNRRPRVAPLEPRDIDSVYAGRILVEALAIRLTVPGLGDEDVEGLRRDLDLMSEASQARDVRAWEPAHRAFHDQLLQGADPILHRIVHPLVDRSERYRRISLFNSPARVWELGNDEHEAIVDACAERDAGLAADLLARHFARSALTVLAKVDPSFEPVALRMALQIVRRPD